MEKIKAWFWVLFSIFIAALIVAVVAFGIPALSSISAASVPARTLTVTAEGKTTATPDLAELTFGVITQGSNPQDLSKNNNDEMNSVINFVENQGVATSDVKTVSYNLQPNYVWDKTYSRNDISGYTLTQTVEVKIHDFSKIATILGGLPPLGVNQIGGVTFTFADQDQVVAAARADAFNKATEKAKEMASEAGAKLGRVISVSENNYIPFPQTYSNAMAVPSAAGMSAPEIQPGTQDITDNVNIVYELD